jgi:ubiquitin C-terminal hydrolase
VPGLPL